MTWKDEMMKSMEDSMDKDKELDKRIREIAMQMAEDASWLRSRVKAYRVLGEGFSEVFGGDDELTRMCLGTSEHLEQALDCLIPPDVRAAAEAEASASRASDIRWTDIRRKE